MRKSTIVIGIAVALSAQAAVATTNADAAVNVNPSGASLDSHRGASPQLFQVSGTTGGATCGAGELCLEATVGTDLSAGACGTETTIDATVGDQLNFCYTITNNTGVDLDYHSLTNDVDGLIFNLASQPLANGATFRYNKIENVSATETYHSTWVGQNEPSGYAAQAAGGGCAERIFIDGFDGSSAPCGSGFVDITGTGTALNNRDDEAIAVTMPFPFDFYGVPSSQLCVDNNGFILFGMADCSSIGGYWSNTSLPAALPAPVLMPMWDDFVSKSGNVYVDTRGTSPNRQFIVEWFDRVHSARRLGINGATFEVIFNEADGTIQFEYADVEYPGGSEGDCHGGSCATIGLQSAPLLYNQFSAFEQSVADGTGIRWAATHPQAFDAAGSVTVNVGAAQIVVNDGNSVIGAVAAGASTTIQIPIENIGNRDLDWTVNEAGPADRHFPKGPARVAQPLGAPSTSTLAAVPPALRPPAKPDREPGTPNDAPAVPVFAVDTFWGRFQTYDALNPSVLDIIANTNGDAFVGGAFMDSDFSKMYVIIGQYGAGDYNWLGSLDTATGAFTAIGDATNSLSVGEGEFGAGYSGLSWDPATGKLFAVSSGICDSLSRSYLWTIDPATGAPTAVGEITGMPCAAAIAVNSAGEMYALDLNEDALFAVDKWTGRAALVGSIGFNANYQQDMAFDLSTDTLYYEGYNEDDLTDKMYIIDTATGLATPVAGDPYIGPGYSDVDAMAIATVSGPCAQPQDQPWLSVTPAAGTTAPGNTSTVTVHVDGAGASSGDVLAGTICTISNDPHAHMVETPVTITVGGG